MRLAWVVWLAACSHDAAPPAPAPGSATPAAKTPAPAPPAAIRGKVETRTFHSEALGVDKDYVVYTPPGYDARPNARFPVLYYLHGLGGNETNWLKGGHIDAAAEQVGVDAIIVMPDGDDAFYTDSPAPIDYDACMQDGSGLFIQRAPLAKTCVKKRAYETYIVKDLVAEVDAKFRTIAARDGRGIAGLSMGGFGALKLSMRHPDLFAAAASHSGVDALTYAGPHPYVAGKAELVTDIAHWGMMPDHPEFAMWFRSIFTTELATWQANDPAALVTKLAPGQIALYLDCGTEDDFALNDGAAYLHDVLVARKYDHVYFTGPGRHDFTFWRPRLPESLKFLRDHVAKPTT